MGDIVDNLTGLRDRRIDIRGDNHRARCPEVRLNGRW